MQFALSTYIKQVYPFCLREHCLWAKSSLNLRVPSTKKLWNEEKIHIRTSFTRGGTSTCVVNISLQGNWFLLQHKDIENRSTQFANSDEEKAALEKIVIELRGQLQDLERIDLEKRHLEDKLKAVEEELKDTVSFICCQTF